MPKSSKHDFEIRPYGLDREIHKYSCTQVTTRTLPDFLIALGKFARKSDHHIEHINISHSPDEMYVEVYWGG